MNRQMTVSQLSRYIKGVFEDEELLHDVTLSGEVAEVSYSDRHTFLVLAEGAFSVRCVHFSSRDQIEKGAKVALRGSVGYYDKRNSVSFTYTEFFVQGVGDKNVKLIELRNKLGKLGYFENRPQLPKYISDVVVVTSPDGAAIRDFIRVVHDKNPFVSVHVYPVKVQGEGAAAQMTDAVKKLQSVKTDAIVLCRGGGSDEDLDSFNDEQLAVAVAQSEIPVISAVGHEVDYTLCDFCAGTRAGTPSIAGEVVNAHAGLIFSDIIGYMSAIKAAVEKKCEGAALRVNRLGTKTTAAVALKVGTGYSVLRRTADRCAYAVADKFCSAQNRVCLSAGRLRGAAEGKCAAAQREADRLGSLLGALDPHRIIKIGYAAVHKRAVRVMTAAELKENDSVQLVFSDGTASAVITEVKENHG